MPPSDHVLVGGSGRSGTTVVGELIGAHSRYTCLPFETRFQTELLRLNHGRITFDEFCADMRGRWMDRFRGNEVDAEAEYARVLPEELLEGAVAVFERTWAEDHLSASRRLVHTLLGAAAAINGTAGWVDSSPVNLLWTAALHDLIPDALFVHVIRDGRDVAASVVRRWGVMDHDAALDWWYKRLLNTNLSADRPDGFVGPGVAHIVRLEALVRDEREATYAALLRFLDVEDEPRIHTFFTEILSAETANIGGWRRTQDAAEQASTTRRYRELLDLLAEAEVECAPALAAAVDDS